MRFLFSVLTFAALAAASADAQGRDPADLESLTVLQVDPVRNEIRAQEPGSTRVRIIEFDDRTRMTGGALGAAVDPRALQPGDRIRVPGAVGSVSDRVRADEVDVLTTPRAPGAMSPGDVAPREGFERQPDARDRREPGPRATDPAPAPGALGSDPSHDPGALGRDPAAAPGALGRDPAPPAGSVGADPGATGDATRGTGSGGSPRRGSGSAPSGGASAGGGGASGSGGGGSGGGGS